MKAVEQYFSVVLFIMLYKVALTFESVDGILNCNYLNESYPIQYFTIPMIGVILSGLIKWVYEADWA